MRQETEAPLTSSTKGLKFVVTWTAKETERGRGASFLGRNNQIGILDHCDCIVKVVPGAIGTYYLRLHQIRLEIKRESERYYGSRSTRVWGLFRVLVGGEPKVNSRFLF